jgi:ferrous iron transport protein B
MATLVVTRREAGSWRWAWLQFGGLTVLAYIVSLVVYQVGRIIT